MGLGCKPYGKFKSFIVKVENKKAAEIEAAKQQKKNNKKDK